MDPDEFATLKANALTVDSSRNFRLDDNPHWRQEYNADSRN